MQKSTAALCMVSAERVQCWLVRDKKHFFFVVTDKGKRKPLCTFIKMSIKPSRVDKLRWKSFREMKKKDKEKKMRVIQPHQDKHVSVGSIHASDEKAKAIASPEMLRAFLGHNHQAVQKTVSRHIKEYVHVFDLLGRSEKEALSYCKEHKIALLHASLDVNEEDMKKKEEWEEILHARESLRTGKAWIDLNLKI
ncbi:MAG: hypothetical protein FJZ58_02260 [Chlamydiae bacterium]|nr:hypothetical protein [Chlamydiota bacterium]